MTTADALVIQTEGLSKTFKGVQALSGLSLKVQKNSIFGFLGPNGAGKSTTIKLLLGLIHPTAGAIGMIILSQDKIIREKQSGTAAWILSKPVARQAFILTKLLANLAGATVFIVLIPALVGLVEIYLAVGHLVPLLPFLGGMGIALLSLLFYTSLTLMLGVLFDNRGPVLGIAFGLMFGGQILASLLPAAAYVLPISGQDIALAVATGQPLNAVFISQIISTLVLTVLFAAIAVVHFQREEF